MTKKITDFLSSFGMMLLGVALLFIGSVKFTARPTHTLVESLPMSHPRLDRIGGDVTPPQLPVSHPAVPISVDNVPFGGALTAKSAIVEDDTSGAVLFKSNSDEVRPLASITKLMTALVLLDLKPRWASSTVVIAGDEDGGDHHTNPGEQFTIEDLWHIALVGSSNSAINALVRASGASEQDFVQRMNDKAAALHFTSMHFVEPTGIDAGNVGSAYDVARLLKEALKVDKIYHTLQISEYYAQPLNSNKKRQVWATDWLLTKWIPSSYSSEDVVGKTGYIDESGYNFAVRLTDAKYHSLRIVILGAGSNELRFTEARDLAEWAFSHYVWPDEEGFKKLVE